MIYVMIQPFTDYDEESTSLHWHVFDAARNKHALKEMAGYLGLEGDNYKALAQWTQEAEPGDVVIIRNERAYTYAETAIIAVAEGQPVRISKVSQETKQVTQTTIQLVKDHSRPTMKKKSKKNGRVVE